jgi:hypothetical protein
MTVPGDNLPNVGNRGKTLRRLALGVCVAVILVLAGFGSYSLWGGGPSVTVLDGVAFSSGYQAQATVDGWQYNIPLDVNWYSATGGFHEGGDPACLTKGLHPISFGYVPVTLEGTSWRQLVWVSCSPAGRT